MRHSVAVYVYSTLFILSGDAMQLTIGYEIGGFFVRAMVC